MGCWCWDHPTTPPELLNPREVAIDTDLGGSHGHRPGSYLPLLELLPRASSVVTSSLSGS